MRVWTKPGLLCCCLLALPTWAQNAPGSNGSKEVIANGSLFHSLLAAQVTGHPYSAVQVHTTERTLADGTKISHHGHHIVARDAEGRVHVEMRLGKGENGQPGPAMVFVLDPVAHTLTTWVAGPSAPKQALVYKLPASPQTSLAAPPPPAHATASTRPQPSVTVEDLGTESLEGVTVSVQRTTTVVPIGRSGNDAPITKTRQIWMSPEMKVILKERWEDPRIGVRTVELTKLSLVDPEPALFQPPSGYQSTDAIETLKALEKKLGDPEP